MEARIDQDFEIKQKFALLCTGEASCIRGNLLVIPIEGSILYVEPLYLQSAAVRFPELKQVILATSERVVMESTLDLAIAALVGKRLPTGPGDQPPGRLSSTAEQLRQIEGVLSNLKEGFTSLEEALAQLKELIDEEEQQ